MNVTRRRAVSAAHPRSRGENGDVHNKAPIRRGSSPLTRGKHLFALHAERPERLIPAHAGKTPEPGRRPGLRGAHPRSRGENRPRTAVLPARCGSSPLTRGKQSSRKPPEIVIGLIPAHAGKTRAGIEPALTCPAHPRSRGENCVTSLACLAYAGSSPLTRGKPSAEPDSARASRLIPAHAGKTP